MNVRGGGHVFPPRHRHRHRPTDPCLLLAGQGIRRIVAYTAGAADAAIAEGARLETALKAADSLAAEELEAAVNALKVEVDTSVIPFSKKAELRTIVTSLHTKVTPLPISLPPW